MGTEFGLFYSNDGGASWAELRGDLPTVAINDLVVHPRDNDLVLATHGRGVWILDNVNALQELGDAEASAATLFSMEPAEEIRYRFDGAHVGDAVFFGENPPAGAIIDYWLREPTDGVALTVHDASGEQVASLEVPGDAGINRVIWDLRYSESAPEGAPSDGDRRPRPSRGPFVVPGVYTIRLKAAGVTAEKPLEVREDPRVAARVAVAERRRWTETLLDLATLRRDTRALSRRVRAALEDASDGESEPPKDLVVLGRETGELASRARRLEGEAAGVVGPLTADQESERAFLEEVLGTLEREADGLLEDG